MNEHQTCTCPTAHGNDFPKVTDHYCVNFIPTGWRLEYTSLSQKDSERVLYLTGQCLRCGGQDLQCGVSIPNELTGDALLAHIYQEMTRYRPFERRYDDGTYSAGLSQRARWYMGQDDFTLNQRNAQFLLLFQEKDWGTVEEWINCCRAEEAHTTPHRDRKSTLLYAVLERARATGDLKEIEPILDYYLPNEEEPLSPKEDSYLTNYAFSAEAKVSFGCEGIFVDLDLVGTFDDSGKDRCRVGTFKTLREDAEAGRLMGQLCGILMYHATKYVNENIHRYTPKKELEAELHRKLQPQEAR